MLEINEGLAEYTGVKLSGRNKEQLKELLNEKIKQAAAYKTLVRSFAYVSGPFYGYLLDRTGSEWRKEINKKNSLSALLQTKLNIILPGNIEKSEKEIESGYNGTVIRESELQREEERIKIKKHYKEMLVEGQVLTLPLRKMKVQFDPRNLVPLDSLGTVYPTIKITDSWGVLEAEKGALLKKNWSAVILSAKNISGVMNLKGDGWTVQLNEGWVLRPIGQKGNYTIEEVK